MSRLTNYNEIKKTITVQIRIIVTFGVKKDSHIEEKWGWLLGSSNIQFLEPDGSYMDVYSVIRHWKVHICFVQFPVSAIFITEKKI